MFDTQVKTLETAINTLTALRADLLAIAPFFISHFDLNQLQSIQTRMENKLLKHRVDHQPTTQGPEAK